MIRRVIYTREDELLRLHYEREFSKYCECGNILPSRRMKYCGKYCKQTYNPIIRKKKEDYTPEKWLELSDLWKRKNALTTAIAKIGRELFPGFNEKPEGVTACAHNWAIRRVMLQISPNLRKKL